MIDWLRSLAIPGTAFFVALAILLTLGLWQLERREWKRELIAAAETRARSEPTTLASPAEWPRMSREADEYRRVRVAGVFEPTEAFIYTVGGDSRVAPRTDRAQGQGYFLVQALRLNGGGQVLVNRGFIPADRLDPATRPETRSMGLVEVTGLLRFGETPGLFAAPDDRALRIFYTRSILAVREALGVREAAIFMIDQDAGPPGRLPIGGETRLTFPNRHLEYALTWFGLAFTLVGVFLAFARQRLRHVDRTR